MKYVLVKPELNAYELSKLNFLASYLGWIFRYNSEKQSALFETDDKNVGYIQKGEFNKLFIVWKSDESIQFIDEVIDLCKILDNHGIVNDTLDNIKMFFGINNVTGYKITKKMIKSFMAPKYPQPLWT